MDPQTVFCHNSVDRNRRSKLNREPLSELEIWLADVLRANGTPLCAREAALVKRTTNHCHS
jgi:hypothetical protein